MAEKKKVRPKEVVDLDETFMTIAGSSPPKRKKSSASTVLVCIACVILLCAILAGIWLLFSDNWLTMNSMTIAGVDVTGMTMKDAKLALQNAYARYRVYPVTVTVMDTTLEIEPAAVGAVLDADAAIDEAYWNPARFDVWNFLTLNKDAIRKVVDQLGSQYNAALQETTVTLEGNLPDLSPNAADGAGQTLLVQIGSPEMGLDTELLYQKVLDAYITDQFSVTGECTIVDPSVPDPQALFDEYVIAPVDAVMDPVTFEISSELFGYGPDVQEATRLLANVVYEQQIRIPFVKIAPKVTQQDLANTLFQDILGECTTPYSGNDNNNRNTNLGLSCEKMNGVVILPGESFSYNLALGERTAANGWKPAASYVGEDTVDTYGGGICQGSSTLYNCVLQADLQIDQRYNHGYISSYTQPGLDATVSWGAVDFVFTNSTNWPIKLEAYRANGEYTVRIYGTDEKDYYVKMSYNITSTKPYETKYKEIPEDDNPKGYKDGQVIVDPYTGYTVITYKTRYSKATNEVIETVREAINYYRVRDKVVVKIVKNEPTETTTPAATAE